MFYFFDSSSLTKRYIAETGSQWVQNICIPSPGNTIVIARITPAEVTSAAQRRKRNGKLSDRDAQAVRIWVDRHTERQYEVVEIAPDVVEDAENLLLAYKLSASDAIQLACAVKNNLFLQNQGYSSLTFVCSDAELTRAARAEGLLTDDPNLHP